MSKKEREYTIEYKRQFIEDILIFKKAGQKSILIKINSLIDEIQKHPTTGTGKPEALKGDRKGQWSRRITGTHRLVYEIYEEIITVMMISAHGHYGDK